MVALITSQDMREYVETDINAASLQRLIDVADAEIVELFGEHTVEGTVAATELHTGGSRGLVLDRPWSSITTITETWGTTDTVLAADDWRAWYGNRILERLALNATNPQAIWGERVSVVYIPVDDDKAREGATIDLVKLAIQNTGLKSERSGDYSTTAFDMELEKTKILRRLDRSKMMPV